MASSRQPAGGDRRRFVRVDTRFMVRYRQRDDAKTSWALAPLRNVGVGGIMVLAEAETPAGEVLDLQLMLPSADAPIAATGKVIWTRKTSPLQYEHGITFLDLPSDGQRALQRIVDLFTPKSPDA